MGDHEYERCGVCNVFMASESLADGVAPKSPTPGNRARWSRFVRDIAGAWLERPMNGLVMNSPNTHTSARSTGPVMHAKALWNHFEFAHAPDGALG